MAGSNSQVEGNKKISPNQRAQMFASMTRKNWQPLPAVAGAASSTVQFTLTKSRLFSRLWLQILATVTYTQAGNVPAVPSAWSPYDFIRNVRVEYNNGWSPFNITGRQLYMYNLMRNNSSAFNLNTAATAAAAALLRNRNVMGLQSAAAPGQANVLRFVPELPIAINERDPVSLFLLQNEEVTVTVTVEFDASTTLHTVAAGLTSAVSAMTVTPVVETFSIPPVADAMPDLGMIKIVSASQETIAGAGPYTFKLRPGNMYRKIAVYIEDGTGGEFDGDLSGNFEIVFNEADTPVRIPPWVLSSINSDHYGQTLPNGLWVFDFTYQGLANYGGARDLIDSREMTELWFKFTAAAAGNITILQETLARAAA